MMENKWLKIFLAFAFLMHFSIQAEIDDGEENSKQYYFYIREIVNSFVDQMEGELNLHFAGEGGSFHKEVEEISIRFNAYRRATIQEARALQLYVMNKLLAIINAHAGIQAYLIERPFTYKHVEIVISFKGLHGPNSDGTVELMFNVPDSAVPENKNKIIYFSNDPFLENSFEIAREPYEEAVKLTKNSALEFPFSHKTTELETALDKSLIPFANMVKMDRGLESWGIGGKLDNGVEEIRAKFIVRQHTSKEEARNLAVFFTENLIDYINRNEKLRPYLKEYPFPSSRVKFRINFTDRDCCSYFDGSMEMIVLEGNELSYYHRVIRPEEHLPEDYWLTTSVLWAKEPYPEALQIVKETPPPSLFQQIMKLPTKVYHWFR